jgi:hypothetical protein
VFDALAPSRTPESVPSGRFRVIGKWLQQANAHGLMLADFDIIYKTVTRRYDVNQLLNITFVHALVTAM